MNLAWQSGTNAGSKTVWRWPDMRESNLDLRDFIDRYSDEYKQRKALLAILEYAISETTDLDPDAARHLETAKLMIASKITSELVMKH